VELAVFEITGTGIGMHSFINLIFPGREMRVGEKRLIVWIYCSYIHTHTDIYILWLVRPRAVVALQHSCRCLATVVECFHEYAHHSALSRCMVTNSSKARFSIGPSQCYIKKATESRVSLSLRRSVFGVSQSLDSEWVSLRQCVSESPESEESSARSEL
jgi:hypothetical protein